MVDPTILALRRLRQGNLEFKAVKGDSYLKRKTKVKNNSGNMVERRTEPSREHAKEKPPPPNLWALL